MTEFELKLLADVDMLLMAEKEVKGRICYSVLRYTNANN